MSDTINSFSDFPLTNDVEFLSDPKCYLPTEESVDSR